MEYTYPFEAIVGQEKAKKAILLNIINPKIGGVLLSGEKGTGKTTLIRGLNQLDSKIEVINVPLNITEDRLLGGIDFEKTLSSGKRVSNSGLLKRANKNILYIDEINLLGDYLLNSIFEVNSQKINLVEREGVSIEEESDFILIGSMNPEEGTLRNQFLEKFGLYVNLKGSEYLEERVEIVKRRLNFEKDKEKFIKKYEREGKFLKEKLILSKKLIKNIEIGQELINLAMKIVLESNVSGNNVEYILLETSKAIAAYNGRDYINIEDLKEASKFVLSHRINKNQEQKQESKNSEAENNSQNENTNTPSSNTKETTDKDSSTNELNSESNSENDKFDDENANNFENQDRNYSIGEIFKVKKIDFGDLKREKVLGSGKRCKTISNSLKGRYIKSIIPKGKVKDLAFDATLRAAAPYQKLLEKNGMAVVIKKEHIREKIREKRVGTSILFTVDASGSMGANERMKEVKGAIFSLLKDAYEKRDRIGLVAFRKDSAEELLPMTRSIELANKKLQNLPVGGKTPLHKGLEKSYTILQNEKKKNKNIVPVLVLVTDGKISTKENSENIFTNLLKFCEHIKETKIKVIVIDSEKGRIKLNMAKDISEKLGGKYYRLEDLKLQSISKIVRDNI
ncbi:VWA domain-containing protein [Cetobacterium sp.]|uniref:VWA domain-containing protein n=1 Tax=Cetobacterium sp. TaxID=2071632 RepID=UPI002FC5B376